MVSAIPLALVLTFMRSLGPLNLESNRARSGNHRVWSFKDSEAEVPIFAKAHGKKVGDQSEFIESKPGSSLSFRS